MPYKDKEKQRESVRKAVHKHRGITEGITKGIANESLLVALADPVKREKLQRICAELKAHRVLQEVFYGVEHPVGFDRIASLYESA